MDKATFEKHISALDNFLADVGGLTPEELEFLAAKEKVAIKED